MIDDRTGLDLKRLPILKDNQIYIYVMVNEIDKIKIGITKNIHQRYSTLCGSNSQGVAITSVYCSPATYLYSLEKIMHQKYAKYRITGTEWFYGDDLTYEEVVKELEGIFHSESYETANENRRRYICKVS